MATRSNRDRREHHPVTPLSGRCRREGNAAGAARRSSRRAVSLGILIAATLLGEPPAAAAADACAESRNEQALLTCREKGLAKAESELAQLVAALHKNYRDDGAERAALLTKAQAAWKSFRDAECKSLNYESQGTGYKAYLMSCMTEMTRSRVAELKKLQENP